MKLEIWGEIAGVIFKPFNSWFSGDNEKDFAELAYSSNESEESFLLIIFISDPFSLLIFIVLFISVGKMNRLGFI